MKSFKQFLSEEQTFDLEKFKSDCAFFIDKTKAGGAKAKMFRGTRDKLPDWRLSEWEGRTEPRNTPKFAHDALNAFFEKKFGVQARNWQFATGDVDQASTYSGNNSPEIIFPVGKFEWLNCTNKKYRDLTIALSRERGDIRDTYPDKNFMEIIEAATDRLIRKLDSADWHFNNDLLGALLNHNEIMFKCDKYYRFNPDGQAWGIVENYLYDI